jgi:hypothetical protein
VIQRTRAQWASGSKKKNSPRNSFSPRKPNSSK